MSNSTLLTSQLSTTTCSTVPTTPVVEKLKRITGLITNAVTICSDEQIYSICSQESVSPEKLGKFCTSHGVRVSLKKILVRYIECGIKNGQASLFGPHLNILYKSIIRPYLPNRSCQPTDGQVLMKLYNGEYIARGLSVEEYPRMAVVKTPKLRRRLSSLTSSDTGSMHSLSYRGAKDKVQQFRSRSCSIPVVQHESESDCASSVSVYQLDDETFEERETVQECVDLGGKVDSAEIEDDGAIGEPVGESGGNLTLELLCLKLNISGDDSGAGHSNASGGMVSGLGENSFSGGMISGIDGDREGVVPEHESSLIDDRRVESSYMPINTSQILPLSASNNSFELDSEFNDTAETDYTNMQLLSHSSQ